MGAIVACNDSGGRWEDLRRYFRNRYISLFDAELWEI